jgi:integrase
MGKKSKGRADGLIEIKIEVGRTLDGKAIRKSFYGHTKKEAKDKAEEFKNQRQYGEIDEKITLSAWADKWLDAYKSNLRQISYDKTYKYIIDTHIKPYFKDARLAAIRQIDIQEFFKSKADYSISMIEKIKVVIKAMFNAAIENDLIIKSPVGMSKIYSRKAQKPRRAYTEEEVRNIINFAKTHRYGAAIITMLKTGLRRSELLALRWQDIDLKNKTLSVKLSVSVSGGGIRIEAPKTPASMDTLPIDDELKSVFQSIPRMIGERDYVFHKKDGNVLNPDVWEASQYRTFMRDYKMHYMKEHEGREPQLLTPHELRHTFGSLIYEATRDIYITCKLMRHTDISTTQKTYVHEQMDTKREAVEKLSTTTNQK